MTFKITGKINFPSYSGVKCYMMPFIQGVKDSLPSALAHYGEVIEQLSFANEIGKVGFVTIDESYVEAGKSQRGYGAKERTLHTEACLSDGLVSWGPSWGSNTGIWLEPTVRAKIANSIDDTCMVWNNEVFDTTLDGDLSERADEFPRSAGKMMKAGEIFDIGIWTPHECIDQIESGFRQFIRVVGNGVKNMGPNFTVNEKVAFSY